MGDIKRKRKKFSRPRKPFDLARIESENKIVKEYGLKNKREIWKAKTSISGFRRRAKALIGEDIEKHQKFFAKLNRMGIEVTSIADILALTEEDLLKRRLQTILFRKKLANSAKQARQFIVHKNVFVDGKVVNIPSFIVTRDLEDKISVRARKVKVKEEAKEEVNDGG